jgi:dienelactone hydrolase
MIYDAPEIYSAPAQGPYKVLLKRGEFTDSSRQNEDGSIRVVPYKIYHPADHDLDNIPLIIWSHGFGGSRDGASFLSRYLASHGYIIAHLTHHGTDSSLWEGKAGHPWDLLRKARVNRHTTLNRMYDVPFALDELKTWACENMDVCHGLDFENIGMSGHSFGALTTQIMAGQLIANDDDELISIYEPRFKAGILYSPVPVGHLLDEEREIQAYNAIKTPLLHMTGTDDSSPLEDFGHERRFRVFDNTPDGVSKHMLVKKGGDHMVYNGTRGKLQANPLKDRHEDIIKGTAHAYWDAMLKGDTAAQEWLNGDAAQDFIGDDAELRDS